MEEKLISDTTKMFMACACYALWKRNGFGKQRLAQFLSDVIQVNDDNEYLEITRELKKKFNIDFPEIEL